MFRHASAPGKVLVTGGYLVLERDGSAGGIVLATDARFHCRLRVLEAGVGVEVDSGRRAENAPALLQVHVLSPQFLGADRLYSFSPATGHCELKSASPPNPFIDTAVQFALLPFPASVDSTQSSNSRSSVDPSQSSRRLRAGRIQLVVEADNAFYSQTRQLEKRGLDRTLANLATLPACAPLNCTLDQCHKTGLGSSAALVTSVCACLAAFQAPEMFDRPDSSRWRNAVQRVHALAQFCHCLAQGKIGSGFDVSSACFGSHHYLRFSAGLLEPLLKQAQTGQWTRIDWKRALEAVSNKCDSVVEPIRLPRGLRLMLADVEGGSHSPSMVRRLLAWRSENPELGIRLWTRLNEANMKVESAWRQLLALEQHPDYDRVLSECADRPAHKWPTNHSSVLSTLLNLSQCFQRVRETLRELTNLSGVPIEPASQTQLLHRTMDCPGTVMAGVPGAGGYDAIFVVLIDQPACLSAVETCWLGHAGDMRVGPLLVAESRLGLEVTIGDQTPQHAS